MLVNILSEVERSIISICSLSPNSAADGVKTVPTSVVTSNDEASAEPISSSNATTSLLDALLSAA